MSFELAGPSHKINPAVQTTARIPVPTVKLLRMHGKPIWVEREDGWKGWGIVEVLPKRSGMTGFRIHNPDVDVITCTDVEAEQPWKAYIPYSPWGGIV